MLTASKKLHTRTWRASIQVIFFGSLSIFTPLVSHTAVLAVTGGQATINYREDAFNEDIYQDLAFFSQTSNSTNYANITAGTWTPTSNTWNLPGDVRSWSGLVHQFNGSSVTSPTGRTLQATNLTYDPANLTGTVNGQIGLAGLARLELDPQASSGSLLFGDFGLFYNATASQWQLKSTIAGFEFFPITHFFSIQNAVTTVNANGFTLTGDLFMTEDVGGALPDFYQVSKVNGKYVSVGNISVDVLTVPEPSRALLLISAIAIFTWRRRRSL